MLLWAAVVGAAVVVVRWLTVWHDVAASI